MTDGCVTTIECLPERSVLAGVAPTVLVGNRGSTILTATTPAGQEELVPKYRKPFCLGDRGDKVLIQGHVLTQYIDTQAFPILRPDFTEDHSGAAMPVKLRVRRCKFPGWTYVDSDQSIIMDGGEALEVQIVAPISWVVLPSEVPPVELPATLQYVDVRVRACVLHCCPPRRSTLTWYGQPITAGRDFDRPRRATELWIAGSVGGAPGLTVWHWESQTPGFVGGAFNVNGSFVNGIIFPGSLETLVADTDEADVVMIWRIE